MKEIFWDNEQIIKKLHEKLEIQSLAENTYINHLWRYSGQSHCDIFCLYRKKVLKISEAVLSELWIKKVIALLYQWTYEDLISNEFTIWGDLVESVKLFEQIEINNYEDLIKYSIYTYSEKIWWTYNASSKFSYALLDKIPNKYLRYIDNVTGGQSDNKEIAIKKSISESIERISVNSFRETTEKGENNLEYNWIVKNNCSSAYIENKYLKIVSQSVDDLLDRTEKLFVPNELLYYPYPDSKLRGATTSSGMATHFEQEKAILNWLLELIERDIFHMSWLLKSWINQIKIDVKKDYFGNNSDNFTVKVFEITLDNPVPVLLVWCYDKDKRSFVILSTWTTLEDAFDKGMMTASKHLWLFDSNEYQKLDDNIVPIKHLKYYMDPNNFDKLSWLNNADIVAFEDLSKKYKKLTLNEILNYYAQLNSGLDSKSGVSFWKYEYKNIINKIFGRSTYRVLSDWLIPLFFGKIPDNVINNSRLLEWKKKLNIDELNWDLHPLA